KPTAQSYPLTVRSSCASAGPVSASVTSPAVPSTDNARIITLRMFPPSGIRRGRGTYARGRRERPGPRRGRGDAVVARYAIGGARDPPAPPATAAGVPPAPPTSVHEPRWARAAPVAEWRP